MTRLKRLCIDWFWPDRTTFITKGKRYGTLYLALGSLCCVLVLPGVMYCFYLVKVELEPRVAHAIAEFEVAIKASERAAVADFERALHWLRELSWLPEFVCYLFLLMTFILAGWAFGCGILLLRANQALSKEMQMPPDGSRIIKYQG
jgi:hypothetical protein